MDTQYIGLFAVLMCDLNSHGFICCALSSDVLVSEAQQLLSVGEVGHMLDLTHVNALR